MQHSLSTYVTELQTTTAEKERIERDLAIAHEIQMGMIPKIFPPYPERDDIDLHAVLHPAKEVGGDLYDFFIDDDHLYFVIGDVSGKEVVQLYASAPQTAIRKPGIELKAFGKTKELKPGESETVELRFTDYDLASFDEENSQWLTSKGKYTLSFGSSSKDFKATVPFGISKSQTWKVNDVLKPVEKISVMKLPAE